PRARRPNRPCERRHRSTETSSPRRSVPLQWPWTSAFYRGTAMCETFGAVDSSAWYLRGPTNMNLPGFTAEVGLYSRRGRHHATSRHRQGQQGVVPQLKGGVFHRPGGGVFGTIEDYYVCKQACDSAYSLCLNSCEGTWDNPKGSTNCLICDQDHNACVQRCSRDIG